MKQALAVGLCGLVAPFLAFAQAPPDIGVAAVTLTEGSYTFDTAEQHKIRVVVVAKGLKHPFSVALLPNGDALVSERGGALRLVHDVGGVGGKAATIDPEPVSGVPPLVPVYRNGGLNDVVLHPQFAQNKLVYFTFNKPGKPPEPDAKPPVRRESIVTLMRAKFSGKALTNVQELFAGESGSTSGSRIAFGKDGLVYMTTGAPFGDQGQQLDSVYGKVLRVRDDGKIPQDNPFVSQAGSRPEVFTIGHRDQLGLTVHPVTGAVLAAEHGPNGGDEVNLILPGHNYGWPKVSFGRTYEGPHYSESPVAEGVDQPLILWLPSIGPSGISFYTGDRFAAWKGNLFVGSVRRGEVPRTGGLERVVVNDKLEELRRETLLTDLHQRIRDVRQGADGLLYVLTDEDDGALLRIEPAS
ncbi:MAG TPA: PQQ-dependent sugar dehydrogenase [Steroidobacteraceae bacterium]|nr:PQQ-dependent sugar dehydrogenase [Steroidobacteraceae bacterium]